MNLEIDATFEGGVFKPDDPIRLEDQQRVRLKILTGDEGTFAPDTNVSLTPEQMARAFQSLGTPSPEEEPLDFDPDEYPLY